MDSLKGPCDLHLHSYYSDGSMSPDELVSYGATVGLAAVAITDHDTIDGQEEALDAGRRYGVEVPTGVEFSIEEDGQSVHILGYVFDHRNRTLIESLRALSEARVRRARLIVEKLAENGVPIQFDDVLREAGKGTVGRPHIAKALYERGFVPNVNDAFVRYIGAGMPCYVPNETFPREEVMRLIDGAGGVAVWAHPGWRARQTELLDKLVASGVRGLEAWHPNHSERMAAEIEALAKARGLFCTGGSDFHFAELMQADIGEITAPYESVLALREAARKPHLT
jgi:predicted metal-dependent phosphoesterase TrpH